MNILSRIKRLIKKRQDVKKKRQDVEGLRPGDVVLLRNGTTETVTGYGYFGMTVRLSNGKELFAHNGREWLHGQPRSPFDVVVIKSR